MRSASSRNRQEISCAITLACGLFAAGHITRPLHRIRLPRLGVYLETSQRLPDQQTILPDDQ